MFLKRSLREEICSLPRLWVNLRTACGCPLQGAGKLSISRSFLMVIGLLNKQVFSPSIPELIPKLIVVLPSILPSTALDGKNDGKIDGKYDGKIDGKTCGFTPSLSGWTPCQLWAAPSFALDALQSLQKRRVGRLLRSLDPPLFQGVFRPASHRLKTPPPDDLNGRFKIGGSRPLWA